MKTKLLAIILFVISITLPLASYAETEYYSFASQLGKPASIEETFESPIDSSVDSDGNVYVAGAASIQKFSSDGKFIAKLNDPNVRPFIEPRGIATDSADDVYVIDSHNSRILKYVNDGKTMTVFANDKINSNLFSHPTKIAIDSADNVYVADHSLKIIQKFSSDGNLLAKWGTDGSKDVQFENISGIAIDSADNVYVADQGYLRNDKGEQTSQPFSRVQKFANNGQPIAKWGLTGLGDGQISNTINIDVDSNGSVYVVDLDNSRIQKFANNGIFVSKFESKDGRLGNMSNPSSITVDPNSGNLYVTNVGDNKVLKFSSDGTYLTEWGGIINRDGQLFATSDVVADSHGDVYAVDSANNAIQKFSSKGEFLTKWGGYGQGNAEFIGPSKIAVDLRDNVYVIDQNNIRKFSPEGKFLAKWGSSGTGDGQISTTSGIAVDSHDNVYVADSYNHRVQKFSPEGKFLAKWGSEGSGNGQFVLPRDVAVDSEGNVYVADSYNHRIQKFTDDGKFVSKWGNADTIHYPKGISTDSHGDVYVIHEGGVTKFFRDGNMIAHFEASDGNDVEFTASSGITIDHDGNVYVSDGNAYALGKGVLKFAKDNTPSDIQTVPVYEKINQDYVSPSRQFHLGMPIEEIKCKDELVLIQKHDGSPACVTEPTRLKLVERGWALPKDETRVATQSSEITRKQNVADGAGLSIKPEIINGKNYLVFEGVGWHRLHNVEITIIDSDGKKTASIRSKTNDNGVLHMPWSLLENLARGVYRVHATDGIHQNDFVFSIPAEVPVSIKSVSSELEVDVSGEKQVRRGTTHSIEIQVHRDKNPVDDAQVFIRIEDYGEDIVREFHGRTNQQGYFVFSWEIPKKFDDIETLLAFVDVTDGISSKTELFKFVVYCLPGEKGCKTEAR